jgi:hypothetical protein
VDGMTEQQSVPTVLDRARRRAVSGVSPLAQAHERILAAIAATEDENEKFELVRT